MQNTLAFAPTEDDLEDFYFDLPVITLAPAPGEPVDDEAAEDPALPQQAS